MGSHSDNSTSPKQLLLQTSSPTLSSRWPWPAMRSLQMVSRSGWGLHYTLVCLQKLQPSLTASWSEGQPHSPLQAQPFWPICIDGPSAHHAVHSLEHLTWVTKGIVHWAPKDIFIIISLSQDWDTADILNTQKKEKKKKTQQVRQNEETKEYLPNKRTRQNLRKELNKHKQFRR